MNKTENDFVVNKILELNIKKDMPPSDVAVANLEIEIEANQKSCIKCIKVIHGYGSHGTGGEIKKCVHILLKRLQKENKIKNWVAGENWGLFAQKNNNIAIDFPELILDSELTNFNNGVTVIFLK